MAGVHLALAVLFVSACAESARTPQTAEPPPPIPEAPSITGALECSADTSRATEHPGDREQWEAAMMFFDRSDYVASAHALIDLHDRPIDPRARRIVLYDLGVVYELAGWWREAGSYYERYLACAGPDAWLRPQVRARLRMREEALRTNRAPEAPPTSMFVVGGG